MESLGAVAGLAPLPGALTLGSIGGTASHAWPPIEAAEGDRCRGCLEVHPDMSIPEIDSPYLPICASAGKHLVCLVPPSVPESGRMPRTLAADLAIRPVAHSAPFDPPLPSETPEGPSDHPARGMDTPTHHVMIDRHVDLRHLVAQVCNAYLSGDGWTGTLQKAQGNTVPWTKSPT